MEIKYVSIENWGKITGIGKSTTYVLLAQGELRAVKVGARTLIDVEFGIRWLASQPAAKINHPSKRAPNHPAKRAA